MSMARSTTVRFRLFWSTAVVSLVAVALWFGADLNTSSAQVKSKSSSIKSDAVVGGIPGTGVGAIPDGGPGCGPFGAPLEVMFDGSGLSGTITNVSVDLDITHSWVGDVRATLVAPSGEEHLLFSDTQSTTATGCGDSSDLGAIYTFNDAAGGDWWAESLNGTGAYVMAAGDYRTSSAGDVPGGGVATDMNATFAAANPTGNWTLRVEDAGGGDTGAVNAAVLNVTAGGGPTLNGDTDFDGDGISDFSVTRDVTPPPSAGTRSAPDMHSLNKAYSDSLLSTSRSDRKSRGEIKTSVDNLGGAPQPGTNRVWYSANSGTPGTFEIAALGNQALGEQIAPADYDGDGQDDFAVWTPVAASGPGGAYFHILNSSTSTVDTIDFGQQGDEAGIVDDYDGDGKADIAVFRQPQSAPFGQTFFFYKGSAGGGEITFVAWGDNTTEDLRAVRGDFDGDGKADFVIHRTNPAAAGSGQYVLLRSSDGGVEYINYGNSGDLLFPGDFDGDGQSDFMKVRIESNNINWYLLERDGGGTGAGFTTWGIIGVAGFSEFAAPGDYDGDGADDIAIYRRDNADPDNCYFYVLRSSDGMLQLYEFGSTTDTPVAVWDQQF